MKSRITLLLILAILLAPFSACIEEIELDIPGDVTDGLAIEGRLIRGNPSIATVKISFVFDFTVDSRVALDAELVLLENDLGEQIELKVTERTVYQAVIQDNSGFTVEPGLKYRIIVRLNSRETYTSEYDLMTDVIPADDYHFDQIQVEQENLSGTIELVDRIEMSVSSPYDRHLCSGYLWEIEGTFQITDSELDDPDTPIEEMPKTCYVPTLVGLNEILLFDGTESELTNLNKFKLLQFGTDFRFNEGMVFKFNQYSLSQSATKYQRELFELSSFEGGLFDNPLGRISSNIHANEGNDREIYGFFYTTTVHSSYLRFPDELHYTNEEYCPAYDAEGELELNCQNCLILNNSTTSKPSFWID